MRRIEYTQSVQASAALGRAGRTEDAQISPDGRRLALAGLAKHLIVVVGLEVDAESDPPRISLTQCLEIRSASLQYPHGLLWADDRTLIVANRQGHIIVLEIPSVAPSISDVTLTPIQTIGKDPSDLVRTPGSVAMARVGLGLIELFACNNYMHHVSRHLLDRRANYAPVASELLLRHGLNVPDGIALDPSGQWIAVSNHNHHNIFIYPNRPDLDTRTQPQAVLRGIRYPHGLRFSADGRTVLVADAGAPLVRVFRTDGDGWQGEYTEATSIRVLDDETFRRGSYNPQEGGPKGVDLTSDGKIMLVSCEEQALAFFDVRELQLPAMPSNAISSEREEVECVRKTLLGYIGRRRGKWQLVPARPNQQHLANPEDSGATNAGAIPPEGQAIIGRV
jgi:hypothetical protein